MIVHRCYYVAFAANPRFDVTTRDLFPTVVHTLVLRVTAAASSANSSATPSTASSAASSGATQFSRPPDGRALPPGTEVLLLRRAGTGYGDGLHQPPGGYVVANESPATAAIRECEEEAGIVIAPEDLRPLCVMPYLQPAYAPTSTSAGSPAGQGIDFIMMAWRYAGTARIGEPHKADLLGWYALDNLPDRAVPFLAPALACWRNNQWYSEFGF